MTYTMSRAMCCTGSRAFASYADVAALGRREDQGGLFPDRGGEKIRVVRKPIGFFQWTVWSVLGLFALLFTLLEFFGGIPLIIGFLAQIGTVPFVLQMTA